MVEGARLESVYTLTRIEGSNPSLSATLNIWGGTSTSRDKDSMNKSEKKRLKAEAHRLNPVIIIGAKGLTQPVLDETNIALDTHELIKIKVNAADKAERLEIAESLCDTLKAEFLQLIGSIAIVYRKNPDLKSN